MADRLDGSGEKRKLGFSTRNRGFGMADRRALGFAVVSWLVIGSCTGSAPPTYGPSVPIRRSIERIHKSTQAQPGRYWSNGYQTYLRDVPIGDLFRIDPAKPLLSEATARFTHVEPEATACLQYVIPSDFPSLPNPTTSAVADYPVMTTTAHARHFIYYDGSPDVTKGRSWDVVTDFQRGVEAAVYDLIDETDAVDAIAGTGTGVVVAYLRSSRPIDLPSGKRFDFRDYGDRLLGEFFFQARPVPESSLPGLIGALNSAVGALSTGKALDVMSRFRDSGVWLTMLPVGAVPPPPSATTCP
jgi:hypothetical protein